MASGARMTFQVREGPSSSLELGGLDEDSTQGNDSLLSRAFKTS
jgi:hypothetical protein